MSNIQNKIALITGGASGIGYKLSEQLLRNGVKGLAILDVNPAVGEKAVATLESEFGKGRVIFLACDVTNANGFKENFNKVVTAFGGLDIMINNAGMLNDRLWEKTIDVNVTALIRGTLMAFDYMGKHKGGKGGTILNVASIVGLTPIVFTPIYSASKHAVVGFTRSMMAHYDMSGVRVLMMCPGVTDTSLVQDVSQKTLDFLDADMVNRQLATFPKQSVDDLVKAMIQLIQKGDNGAIWVTEAGKRYSIDLCHYSKLGVPI